MVLFQYVGIISAHDSTAIAVTAFTGTRCVRETFRQRRPPGTAPSRENANIIRDADVTDACRRRTARRTR